MTAGDAMTVSQLIQPPSSIALHRRKREIEDLYFPHALNVLARVVTSPRLPATLTADNSALLTRGVGGEVSNKRKTQRTGLQAEYRFDYRKGKPNRFASKMASGTVAVILEPDVAAVFKSSESVNALLRSVISALAESRQRKG